MELICKFSPLFFFFIQHNFVFEVKVIILLLQKTTQILECFFFFHICSSVLLHLIYMRFTQNFLSLRLLKLFGGFFANIIKAFENFVLKRL